MIDWGQMPRRLWLTEHTSLACHCQCSKQSGQTVLQSSASCRSCTAVRNKRMAAQPALVCIVATERCASWSSRKMKFSAQSVLFVHTILWFTKVLEISTSAWWQPSYLLPICGFGSFLNRSVGDRTSVDCLMCSAKQRLPDEKKGKGWQQSAQWSFQSFFFFFYGGFRYDNRQTDGRFLSPVSIRQD